MNRSSIQLALCLATGLLPRALLGQTSPAVLKQQVFAAESTFAAKFAQRDTAGFAAMLAPDAVFFGRNSVMRGRAEVIEGWRPLLTKPTAPFSWKPEVVEVAASGNLALTSGPVYDPEGNQFNTFNSIWRREPDGSWRVLFDKGCPVCDCAKK